MKEKNELLKQWLFVLFAYAISITIVLILLLFIIPDHNLTATYISGVLGMFGGVAGAFGAYRVAIWQTNKNIELDKELRLKQNKIDKLEELKETFVSSHFTRQKINEKLIEQNYMIQTLMQKGYTVYSKEKFITPEIEKELIMGVLQFEEFKKIVMKNKEYLPKRIDSLELMTAIYQMIDILNIIREVYKLMIDNKKMTNDEFSDYWNSLYLDYKKIESELQKHASDNIDYIHSDIQENL